MTDSIWNTLSTIDCSDHIEKKGQFSYLAWTWAWAKVKEVYPLAHYHLEEDTVYPDGTMEVRVTVVIPYSPIDDDGKYHTSSHTMWLPVLDFKNKPIPNPNAFDINTARMRCLVKCLAMFGLGHYIYAGESTPAASPELQAKYEEMLGLVAQEKGWELRKFTEDNQAHMDNLFNMAPDGKKTAYKNDVRTLYQETNKDLKANLALLEEAVGSPESPYSVTEVMGDMSKLEWSFTLKGCNEVLRKQVEEKLEAGE